MNIFSEKVDTKRQADIKDYILQKFNAELKPKQYAFWELKTKEFSATFYNSGKFVIQGKDITKLLDTLSEKYTEFSNITEKLPKETSTHPEMPCFDLPYIGTDESGKGDFFGPLIIAGVMLDENNKKLFEEMGIKDSKTLKDETMLKMAATIKNNSKFSIVVINNIRYNELYVKFRNLNKLLAWGHARAIENILEKADCKCAISDKFGDESLIQNALMEKGKKIILEQRVKAERDLAVAAASVLARATFVQHLKDMHGFYGCVFPKGCGENVKDFAIDFTKQFGKKRLYEVCKAHFKTYHELF